MVFSHRASAISMACLASVGLILGTLSGFNCSFISINAEPERSVMTPEGLEFVGQEVANFGVYCASPFHYDTDRMWGLSQVFFWVSLGFGGLTTLLSWALSIFLKPNNCNWRFLSIASAITAVMGIPVFLILESEPCTMDLNRQSCSLGLGAYFGIASIVVWVALTVGSQILNPPKWGKERDAWRASRISVNVISVPTKDDNGTDGSLSLLQESGPRDFGGEVYLTSNDDGDAVWPPNDDHRGRPRGETASIVSSISDGMKDVETGRGSGGLTVSIICPDGTTEKLELSNEKSKEVDKSKEEDKTKELDKSNPQSILEDLANVAVSYLS